MKKFLAGLLLVGLAFTVAYSAQTRRFRNVTIDTLTTKDLNGARNMSKYATAGVGTAASPWTGWESSITDLTLNYFPKGTYSTSSTTSFTTEDSLVLVGDGTQTSVIVCTNASGCFNYNNTDGEARFIVGDLTLRQDTNSLGTSPLLLVTKVAHFELTRVQLQADNAADNTSSAPALQVIDANSGLLYDVTVRGYDPVDTSGGRWAVGLDLLNTSTQNGGNITILGGNIQRTTVGIRIAQSAGNLVNNIQIYGTKIVIHGSTVQSDGVGIQAASQTENLILDGVHIEAYNKGIELTSVETARIMNCIISRFETGTTPKGIELITDGREQLIAYNQIGNNSAISGVVGISVPAATFVGLRIEYNRFSNLDSGGATEISDSSNSGALRTLHDPQSSGTFKFRDDLTLGEGKDENTTITFDQATGTDPAIVWDDNPAQFEFDFDGAINDGADVTIATANVDIPGTITVDGASTLKGDISANGGTDTDWTLTMDNATGTDPIFTWDFSELAFEFDFDGVLSDFNDVEITTANVHTPALTLGTDVTADIQITFKTGQSASDPRIDFDDSEDVLAIKNAGFVLHDCADVAAGATVAVEECNVITFTGTAAVIDTINTCNAAQKGRILYVLCGADASIIGDGTGNVQLAAAANFTCGADDTITIICEGATGDWLELGRSVN